MDGTQNRERHEGRERHAVHSSYIWLGGLQGAAAVFAALLIGVLPQIIPELFNPNALGQFVNGGLATIVVVLLFLGTVVVSLAASLIYRLVAYGHIWYEFGDEEFSFYSGIFNKKRVHVPYRRIQSVDQTASLLQRVFGVCTVQIDTAGGASNKAVSVPFLRKADAEALRVDLFARKSAAVGTPFREADAPSSFGNVLDAPAEVWDDVRGVFAGREVDTGRISFQYGITNGELILTGLSNSTTLILVVVGIIGVFSQVADFVSHLTARAVEARPADASAALHELQQLTANLPMDAWQYRKPADDHRYNRDDLDDREPEFELAELAHPQQVHRRNHDEKHRGRHPLRNRGKPVVDERADHAQLHHRHQNVIEPVVPAAHEAGALRPVAGRVVAERTGPRVFDRHLAQRPHDHEDSQPAHKIGKQD